MQRELGKKSFKEGSGVISRAMAFALGLADDWGRKNRRAWPLLGLGEGGFEKGIPW